MRSEAESDRDAPPLNPYDPYAPSYFAPALQSPVDATSRYDPALGPPPNVAPQSAAQQLTNIQRAGYVPEPVANAYPNAAMGLGAAPWGGAQVDPYYYFPGAANPVAETQAILRGPGYGHGSGLYIPTAKQAVQDVAAAVTGNGTQPNWTAGAPSGAPNFSIPGGARANAFGIPGAQLGNTFNAVDAAVTGPGTPTAAWAPAAPSYGGGGGTYDPTASIYGVPGQNPNLSPTGQPMINGNPSRVPILSSMPSYAAAMAAQRQAQLLGAAAGDAFNSNAGLAVQNSIGMYGQGANNNLATQRAATAAQGLLRGSATGTDPSVQAAYGATQPLGYVASGPSAYQRSGYGANAAAAYGGMASQQAQMGSLGSLGGFANGSGAGQAAWMGGIQGLGAYGAGTSAPQQAAARYLQGMDQFTNGTSQGQQYAMGANAGLGAYGQGNTALQRYAGGANAGLQNFAQGNTGGQRTVGDTLGLLRSAAYGAQPSAAALQMRYGEQQALAQAQSQVGSTRGNFGLANAQKNALGQGAQLAAQTNQATGILRAQEMAQARGDYANYASQNVGQELSAQGQYASNAQQAAALGANAQAGYAQNAEQAAALEQANASQQAGYGQQAAATALQGQLGYASNLGNYTNTAMNANIAQAQGYGQAAATQAGAASNLYSNANAAQGIQAGAASNFANAYANLAAQRQSAQMGLGQLTNASTAQQLAALQGYNSSASGLMNSQLGYGLSQQANAMSQAQMDQGLAIAQGNNTLGIGAQQTQQAIADQSNNTALAGAGVGAVSGVISALLAGHAFGSDERMKTDIHGAGPRNAGEALSQLDHFTPFGFRYKQAHDAPNPQAASAPHVGVLAQDVERGPAGKSLVAYGAGGRKFLNIPAMTGTIAAGAGALKQVTDDHEHRMRALERAVAGNRGWTRRAA